MPQIDVEPSANTRPLWLGGLVAPWSAPILLALLAARGSGSFLELLVWALVIGLPISGAGLFFILLPWVLWLQLGDRLVVWRVLAVGVPAGGVLLAGLLHAIGAERTGLQGTSAIFGVGAFAGLTVALVFCLVSGIPWRAKSR